MQDVEDADARDFLDSVEVRSHELSCLNNSRFGILCFVWTAVVIVPCVFQRQSIGSTARARMYV